MHLEPATRESAGSGSGSLRGTVQPADEFTLTRPWHWGVAVLGDPTAAVPDRVDGQVVAVGEGAVAIAVRHSQDVDAEALDGEWATATVHVHTLSVARPVERNVVCDVVLRTIDRRISLGDAEEEVVLPSPGARTRVIVSCDEVDPTGLDTVWIDLVAAQ